MPRFKGKTTIFRFFRFVCKPCSLSIERVKVYLPRGKFLADFQNIDFETIFSQIK